MVMLHVNSATEVSVEVPLEDHDDHAQENARIQAMSKGRVVSKKYTKGSMSMPVSLIQ